MSRDDEDSGEGVGWDAVTPGPIDVAEYQRWSKTVTWAREHRRMLREHRDRIEGHHQKIGELLVTRQDLVGISGTDGKLGILCARIDRADAILSEHDARLKHLDGIVLKVAGAAVAGGVFMSAILWVAQYAFR